MVDEQRWPEKRQLDRQSVSREIDVVELGSGRLVGRLVNIHEQGLMLLGGGDMECNHLYRLRLETEPTIELEVDCLWINEASGEGNWVGCQITEISAEALVQLKKMGW